MPEQQPLQHPTKSIQVLVPVALDCAFTYENTLSNNSLSPGQLVEVSFRNKLIPGIVWPLAPQEKGAVSYKGKMKPLSRIFDLPPFPLNFLTFIQRVSDYTLSPLGNVLRLVLSTDFLSDKSIRKKIEIGSPQLGMNHVALSQEQEEAATVVEESIKREQFQCFLLDGVTGSGKTEVYLSAIEATLSHGRQALVLLPEIALTTQWLHRFERRFGCAPLQWHSNLTPSRRRQIWQAVLKGEAPVVVGARSGLFLPFPNLGLIIIDEEHDGSFKQEEQVIYNARDMAVLRAQIVNIPILLASATPSLETVQNALSNRYTSLKLNQRHGGASLPSIHTIDMRQQPKGWLSPPLITMMQKTLSKGEQVMLFLNRRGYAPVILCHGCGHRFTCLNCQTCLVEHRASSKLLCHHCGYHQEVPQECPECQQKDTLIPCGPGVERIHEAVQKRFPKSRSRIITSDEITCMTKLQELIRQISNHEIDILIGTQILAKGHHFPMITLVGIIDGDLGLSGGDLRCGEKTYQLLHQVAGRAGRESRPGIVLLQTYQPDHPIMKAIVKQDRDTFLQLELEERKAHGMPPFGRLASITLCGTQNHMVSQSARQLAQAIPHSLIKDLNITILGPAPAPLSYVRGRHRWRFLLKTDRKAPLQKFIKTWLDSQKLPSSVRVTIDIDPYNFM